MGWLGPVVGGVQHEGWVVPLFADGAQAAGTSSAPGILIAPGGTAPADGEQWRPHTGSRRLGRGCDCGWRGGPWTRVSPRRSLWASARQSTDGRQR